MPRQYKQFKSEMSGLPQDASPSTVLADADRVSPQPANPLEADEGPLPPSDDEEDERDLEKLADDVVRAEQSRKRLARESVPVLCFKMLRSRAMPGYTTESLLPTRATSGSAGLDIYVPRRRDGNGKTFEYVVAPQRMFRMLAGWSVAIPSGYYGKIEARSSFAIRGLHILGGVIDSDFRHEVQIIMINFGPNPIQLLPDTTFAQMIIMPYLQTEPKDVAVLPDYDGINERVGGFGSTTSRGAKVYTQLLNGSVVISNVD
jgi:dUTP pyrophosphatase